MQIDVATKICKQLLLQGSRVFVVFPAGSIDHGKTYIGDEIAEGLKQDHPEIPEFSSFHAKTTTRCEIQEVDEKIGAEDIRRAEFLVIRPHEKRIRREELKHQIGF